MSGLFFLAGARAEDACADIEAHSAAVFESAPPVYCLGSLGDLAGKESYSMTNAVRSALFQALGDARVTYNSALSHAFFLVDPVNAGGGFVEDLVAFILLTCSIRFGITLQAQCFYISSDIGPQARYAEFLHYKKLVGDGYFRKEELYPPSSDGTISLANWNTPLLRRFFVQKPTQGGDVIDYAAIVRYCRLCTKDIIPLSGLAAQRHAVYTLSGCEISSSAAYIRSYVEYSYTARTRDALIGSSSKATASPQVQHTAVGELADMLAADVTRSLPNYRMLISCMPSGTVDIKNCRLDDTEKALFGGRMAALFEETFQPATWEAALNAAIESRFERVWETVLLRYVEEQGTGLESLMRMLAPGGEIVEEARHAADQMKISRANAEKATEETRQRPLKSPGLFTKQTTQSATLQIVETIYAHRFREIQCLVREYVLNTLAEIHLPQLRRELQSSVDKLYNDNETFLREINRRFQGVEEDRLSIQKAYGILVNRHFTTGTAAQLVRKAYCRHLRQEDCEAGTACFQNELQEMCAEFIHRALQDIDDLHKELELRTSLLSHGGSAPATRETIAILQQKADELQPRIAIDNDISRTAWSADARLYLFLGDSFPGLAADSIDGAIVVKALNPAEIFAIRVWADERLTSLF